MNKLRNIYTIGRGGRNIKKWDIYNFKIKTIPFIIILDDTVPFVKDKSKSKNGTSVSEEFAYITEVQWGISDLPFVQNKDYQYSVSLQIS